MSILQMQELYFIVVKICGFTRNEWNFMASHLEEAITFTEQLLQANDYMLLPFSAIMFVVNSKENRLEWVHTLE